MRDPKRATCAGVMFVSMILVIIVVFTMDGIIQWLLALVFGGAQFCAYWCKTLTGPLSLLVCCASPVYPRASCTDQSTRVSRGVEGKMGRCVGEAVLGC